MKPTLRSPYEKLAGAYHLPRFVDKARWFLGGEMEREYRLAFGNRRGLDGFFLRHFGLRKADFVAVMEAVPTDDEVAEWFLSDSERRSAVEAWNEFAPTIGRPGTDGSEAFQRMFALYGLSGDENFGVFEAICFDEGIERP